MQKVWKTLTILAYSLISDTNGEVIKVEGMQDITSLWQAVLGEIELSVSRGNYVTWFKPTKVLRFENNKLTIAVGNVFVKQQLDGRYNTLVCDVLKKNGLSPEILEFKIHASAAPKVVKKDDDDSSVLVNALHTTRPTSITNSSTHLNGGGTTSTLAHTYRQGLNEKYTFDNFVVGSGNELAHAACQAAATHPGTKYNPLFLYGGVGIGKTHLMQALGNSVLASNPNARVVYVSSEQFLQEFVDAVRFRKNTDFADFYRGADVLIVDDIQFIAGKEKVLEEFFHTFNALHQANKQIIISSDKPPRDISTLEERLRSRFAWGMAIDMQNPDLETRCAIIINKASSHGVVITQDIAEYLATNVQTNIRELEGVLNRVLAFCEMRGLEPNLNIVTGLIGNNKTRPKHLSARQIVERTARHFQISIEDITGPKRDKDIVVPRQIAMYLMRSELHLSFPKIAHELGRKDHTTAIHSVEKIEKESHLDEAITIAISEIKDKLYV